MGAKPSYAPNENDQMWAVIEQFQAFNDPPLPTLTARQARMTHSVTDAVKTLLAKNNRSAPSPAVTVSQRVLDKQYTPLSAPDGAHLYAHGGG
jgi:acetyl esterase